MKNGFLANKKLLASCVVTTLALPVVSHAQIQEIMVTANKREQSFADVGATMSVMSSENLIKQRISNADDIATAIPSLSYARSDYNTPIYTLRGIGFNEASLGVYPAVSVYLDEAPLTFPTLAANAAFDLERIEVLKGPQGTLFGQNSTGGAINYIAKKPTDELEAGVTTTYGRFDLVEVEGYISGPLTDTLKARVAVKTHNMDDWQYSVTRGDKHGEEVYYTGRAMLDWDPTDDTSVSLTLNTWKDESDPQAMQLAATKYSAPTALGTPNGLPIVNQPLVPEENRAADWGSVTPYSDRELFQTVLRLEHNFADNLLFTSLSSYIDFDQAQATDRDGSAIQNQDQTRMDATIETYSQEFRIENTDVDVYRWVLGFNYENSEVAERQLQSYVNNSVAINTGIFQNTIELDSEMENWAIFGNLDYRLTESLNLKVGARYTDSEYKFRSCNTDEGDGAIAGLFNFLGGLLGTVPFDPIGVGPGQCFPLNFQGVPGDVYNNTLSEDNVSWRVGLDYNLTDNVLLYANISEGYKQGSFPTSSPAGWVGLEPVTQESVLAYEVGTKGQYMDGRVNLNAAAFFYKYDDKQVRGSILDPVFEVLPQLRNIPESEVKGAEVELTVSPVDGLVVSLSTVYLDTEITEGGENQFNDVGQPWDFTGAELPFTAEWSHKVDVEYTWDTRHFSPFVGITYMYDDSKTAAIDGYNFAPIATPDGFPQNRAHPGFEKPFVIDSYDLINARAGVSALDGSWTLFLWAKNLKDDYYWNNVNVAEDNISRSAGLPRTYGATFSYQF